MSKPYDHKTAFELAEFKATDSKSGRFEALVSVFGNVDMGGDRVMPGAFTKSLAQWEEKGDPIPVIWNHMWDNPEAHIGAVDPGDAVETADGLMVKGRIDLDNPFARQVYRLLSERRVKEFSFGYNLVDAERTDDALELLEIDLFEVGPTLKGMNPATELLAVKALAAVTAKAAPGDKVPAVLEPGEYVVTKDAACAMTTGIIDHVTNTVNGMNIEAKAGARHSKETMAALQRIRQQVDELIAAGTPADETPKSVNDDEASGKSSDPDADLRIQIQLLKEAP